ncbi:MAG: DUF349 domain-containing protein [Bacteroidales bacterium]|nr:DUF349 domain-containing protein [Bacteroidales bacterium]
MEDKEQKNTLGEEVNSAQELPNETDKDIVIDQLNEETTSKEVLSFEENILEIPQLSEEESENDLENIEDEELPVEGNEHSREDLLAKLQDVIENMDINEAKSSIKAIKDSFFGITKQKKDAERKEYALSGGDLAVYEPEKDELEEKFNSYLERYQDLRKLFEENQEKNKEDNLKTKYEIIDKINDLINGTESLNKTFQDFHSLQEQWRSIGEVPTTESTKLWHTYNHTIEKFYDFVKINKELRDLDFRKNFEAKIGLCEKAEALMLEPMITKAFKTLQELHEQWREVGPVDREKREEIWERFKQATAKINKKHQDYFEGLRAEQQNNLESKTIICEKIEEIIANEIASHKDWEKKTAEIIEAQKLWKTIGSVPKKNNTEIFQRFKKACDEFFKQKRAFYEVRKGDEEQNLLIKTGICEQAEALKDSNDWKNTTKELIALQKKWKEVGPVPRKNSDAIWKRFRAACDEFFNKKTDFFGNIDKVYDDNLNLKKEIVEKIKNYQLSDDNKKNLSDLQELQKQYSEIGHVPFDKKEEIHNLYRDALNEVFGKMEMDEDRLSIIRFKLKMESYQAQGGADNKLQLERNRLETKLQTLQSDIMTLENNIGFFSNSKKSEELKKDFEQKIETNKKLIKALQQKIRIINDLNK